MKKSLKHLAVFLVTFLVAIPAFAQDGAAASSPFGWYAIAAALAMGVGAVGGALGQGRTASAALEGLARNPSAYNKVFVPFILGMALIESLVIFSFVIAILLMGNIG